MLIRYSRPDGDAGVAPGCRFAEVTGAQSRVMFALKRSAGALTLIIAVRPVNMLPSEIRAPTAMAHHLKVVHLG